MVPRRRGDRRGRSRPLRRSRAEVPRRPRSPHPRNHLRSPRPARSPPSPAGRSRRPRHSTPTPARDLRHCAAHCPPPTPTRCVQPTPTRCPQPTPTRCPRPAPTRSGRPVLAGSAGLALADSSRPVLGRVPAAASVDLLRLRHATASGADFPSSRRSTADRRRGHGRGQPAALRGSHSRCYRWEHSPSRAICRIDPFYWRRRRPDLRKAHSRDPARGYRLGSRVLTRTRRRARDRSVNLASPRAPPRPRRQT